MSVYEMPISLGWIASREEIKYHTARNVCENNVVRVFWYIKGKISSLWEQIVVFIAAHACHHFNKDVMFNECSLYSPGLYFSDVYFTWLRRIGGSVSSEKCVTYTTHLFLWILIMRIVSACKIAWFNSTQTFPAGQYQGFWSESIGASCVKIWQKKKTPYGANSTPT
jgi:hypothetical protein